VCLEYGIERYVCLAQVIEKCVSSMGYTEMCV